MPRKAKVVISLIVLGIVLFLGISIKIIVARDTKETAYKFYFINAFGTFPPQSCDEARAMQPRIDAKLEKIAAEAKNTDPEFPSEYYAALLPGAQKAAAHYRCK